MGLSNRAKGAHRSAEGRSEGEAVATKIIAVAFAFAVALALRLSGYPSLKADDLPSPLPALIEFILLDKTYNGKQGK